MRISKMKVALISTFLIYSSALAQSGDFSVSGRVVDPNHQPIANATITYTNIAQRLSWDFSTANGMFGGPITIVHPGQHNAAIMLSGEGPVSIEVFTVNGRKVGSMHYAKLDKGNYEIEPLAYKLPQSVYILKIEAENYVTFRKLITTGYRHYPSVVDEILTADAPVALAKKSSIIDSIRVGKTGYMSAYVPIQSYIDYVGDVVISPVDIEYRVDSIFALLSQTEKCAQLCMLAVPPGTQSQISSNSCGSIFGGGGALSGSSPSINASSTNTMQTGMMSTTHKIPILAACDFMHGASAYPGATMFPQNLALGAIQDTFLVQKAWRVTALEVRGGGCNWGFGPCIAVIRDDRWGRSYEGFCETPDRTQIMARHAVLGAQLTDLSNPLTYAACCEHFAGDGNTVNGVNPGITVGPDATARAINLPGYKAAVQVGIATIMPSFSKWCDGTPMHTNATLMNGWLKSDPIGFKGFVVGDWEAAILPASIDSGLDVPMSATAALGIISTINGFYSAHQARIDDACKRVLRVKCWMNLFDPKQYMVNSALTVLVGCAAHRDVARQCVRASQVLLKNANNVLPIPKTATLAIWGQGGNDVGIQCGGWTVTWPGQTGSIPGGGGTSIRSACAAVDNNVSFVSSPIAVGNSDYVLAVFSENPYVETSFPNVILTGNDATSTNQNVITQVAAAHAAGKKVIGILIAGRVLDVSGVINNCDAFIWSCLPGTEGEGIADVLFGDYKFSGKLPVTWPDSSAQEPINYGDGQTGLFPYGFGLTD
jgi:beta-glucosidase